MGTTHTCDRCGAVLHHGEMWTVTEKRVGAAAERKHLLCGSCLCCRCRFWCISAFRLLLCNLIDDSCEVRNR